MIVITAQYQVSPSYRSISTFLDRRRLIYRGKAMTRTLVKMDYVLSLYNSVVEIRLFVTSSLNKYHSLFHLQRLLP